MSAVVEAMEMSVSSFINPNADGPAFLIGQQGIDLILFPVVGRSEFDDAMLEAAESLEFFFARQEANSRFRWADRFPGKMVAACHHCFFEF